jgi:hypothetical protein
MKNVYVMRGAFYSKCVPKTVSYRDDYSDYLNYSSGSGGIFVYCFQEATKINIQVGFLTFNFFYMGIIS